MKKLVTGLGAGVKGIRINQSRSSSTESFHSISTSDYDSPPPREKTLSSNAAVALGIPQVPSSRPSSPASSVASNSSYIVRVGKSATAAKKAAAAAKKKKKTPAATKKKKTTPAAAKKKKKTTPAAAKKKKTPASKTVLVNPHELKHTYGSNKILFKMHPQTFQDTRIPNKACRYLLSHCSRRHPTKRDTIPRQVKININKR